MINHIITTHFNLNLYREGNKVENKDAWMERRIELFKKYTVPSIAGQTCDNFTWLVLLDPYTPSKYRNELFALCKNQIIQFTNGLGEIRDQARLITFWNTQNSRKTITTRLDNDDALGLDYVDMVQELCKNRSPGKYLINYDHGVVIDDSSGETITWEHPKNMFLSLIEIEGDPITVWEYGHNKWPDSVVKKENYGDDNMHLHVIHGSNRCDTMELANKFNPKEYSGDLLQDFGVKL